MKLHIENIQRHRNGICGAPFHVLIFGDPNEGRMVGIVFDQQYHVAVFNLDKLAAGNMAFGVNSWRGDRYEPHLRSAIALANEQQTEHHEIDIHAILAERRKIALVWCIEDVQAVRPDLTDEQAWEVLQAVKRQHDATIGVSWLTLECVAEDLFGPNLETDFA
jgi:hypothetical protein